MSTSTHDTEAGCAEAPPDVQPPADPCSEHCAPDCTGAPHRLHVELHAHGRHHRLRDALDIAMLVVIGLAAWYLWPASLGGSARFIVVQGESMAPTYHLGDVILVKEHPSPSVGDVIVFRVPEGEPGEGALVVHRVHSIRPDGSFETKGDNRALPDNWNVRDGDVLGEPVVRLPKFGRLIGLFSNPIVVGAAAGALTMIFLWPRRGHGDGAQGDRDDGGEGDDGADASGEQAGAVHPYTAGREAVGLDADSLAEPRPVA